MNPDLPLRIGLAGVGRFGRLHANVLAHLSGVELVALADPDPDVLTAVADRHAVATRYRDAGELLDDPRLQAVVLATPDGQHAAQVRAALQRGLHVFVEKPLASSWQEAVDLQRLAARAGVTLQAGLILRYEASHRLLKQRIVSGQFGELVSIRTRRNCSRASYAAIADHVHTVHRTLIHDLDLVLWLTGSHATSVMAMEVRQGQHVAPLSCFALLRLASGCVAQLESSWTVPAQAPVNVIGDHWHTSIDAELAVVGTRCTARLQGLQTPLQIWTDQDLQSPDVSLWPECDGQVFGALRDQLADFTDSLRRGEPSSLANLEDAVEAMRIAEAIVAAGRQDGVVRLQPRS